MNNHRTEAYASLNDLAGAIIKLGAKTNDPELLFLGHSLSTLLRAAPNEPEREELKSLINGFAVRRLMRAAGASAQDIIIMEHSLTACAN
jgi:hypothetical protein